MIILLFGEDDFRSKNKLKEIVQEYKKKHQSGLSLCRFNVTNTSFDQFRDKTETNSMFDEKKLIILEEVLANKSFYESFLEYLKNSTLKDDQDIVVVIFHRGKLKDKNLEKQVTLKEEFNYLNKQELFKWVKQKVVKANGTIYDSAVNKLIAWTNADLWQLNNETEKLISYKKEGVIDENDIDLIIGAKLDLNIFQTIDALAERNKTKALNLLHSHIKEGENENYLFSMLAYQFRVLIKLKDLINRGVPFSNLSKQARLHPFVVKKSNHQLRNFDLNKLKQIYKKLLQIDFSIKSGKMDAVTALDIFVAEI